MKKIILLSMMALATLMHLSAQRASQSDYAAAPYFFWGIQGGVQTTFTNYDQMKLLTPTASVSFGAFFTPVVGARIQANGLWNKGGLKPDFTYEYKYVTTDVDLLVNLVTLFGRKDYYPVNLYLLGGVGLNVAWDNKDLTASTYAPALPSLWQKNNISRNGRVGLMLDCNLSRHLSVNLEVTANTLNDRYNSKTSSKDDQQLTAQLGLTYKFGYRKTSPQTERSVAQTVVAEPTPQPVAAAPLTANKAQEKPTTAAVAKSEPARPTKPAVKPEMHCEFFFAIRETVIGSTEKGKFNQLVKFLKENPDAKVNVVGYADAGTGNDEINNRLSRQRAENVSKALQNAGIAAQRILTDSKGADIQPYSENDKNRVVIVVAK